jgi:hypothetical protein
MQHFDWFLSDRYSTNGSLISLYMHCQDEPLGQKNLNDSEYLNILKVLIVLTYCSTLLCVKTLFVCIKTLFITIKMLTELISYY